MIPESPARARLLRGGGALALALALLGATGPQARAASPSPSPAPLRLPVLPLRVDTSSGTCTKGSSTVMKQVPWAQGVLGLSRAALHGDGAGVTVGVVDTGVAAKAGVLSGRVSAQRGADGDCVGHGTFMAGLIAGAPRDGVAFTGVAPGARIYSARGTDAGGTADASLVANGIRAAVDAGCRVVVVAAALPASTAALRDAVRHAAERDVLLVAPAVPDDSDATSGDQQAVADFYPAASPGVLSVADFGPDGSRATRAALPSGVDLAAPGDQLTGPGPSGPGHFLGSGASLAAAYTAGAAALLRARYPHLSASETARRLVRSGYPADPPRLDLNGALTGVLPAPGDHVSAAPAPPLRVRRLG
ncbi:S8 family serine peptidase [Streptomyces flaveolus]|uniref:S8 family serine peptidase n=1 Tax=Streptomyces flaveolus TaxID=67297 RepID=UPI0033B21AC9